MNAQQVARLLAGLMNGMITRARGGYQYFHGGARVYGEVKLITQLPENKVYGLFGKN